MQGLLLYCIVSVLQFTLVLNKIVNLLLKQVTVRHSSIRRKENYNVFFFYWQSILNFLVNTIVHFKSAISY